MKFTELVEHLRAGFTGFWMNTNEPDRIRAEIIPELKEFQRADGEKFEVAEWDCISEDPDPMSPLSFLDSAKPNTVVFLFNYHWYIDRPQIIQKILNNVIIWANSGKALVVVAPIEKIPLELQKIMTLVNLPLPDEEEIVKAMKHVAPNGDLIPEGEELQDVVRVFKGLTRMEIENVSALCLTRHKKFDVSVINDHRALTVKKSGLADILPHRYTFMDIIGYQLVKDQVMDTINDALSKGIILIGPAGTGKTTLAQAIAAEANKLCVMVRTGKLFSKFQGETDQNVEALINMFDSLGDCIALFDEFEKQFSGVGGSGELDSGTTTRMGGRFLEWFQDPPPGVYRIATCNTFRGIPGPYFRPGRWDSSPWYVGLPSEQVKQKILKHYIGNFELSGTQAKKNPDMTNWTGAEIEAVCRNAKMRSLNLIESSNFIKPMAATAKEEWESLEKWAKDRCINAEDIPKVTAAHTKKRKIDMT